MNAGLNGLPGGAQNRRVTGLVSRASSAASTSLNSFNGAVIAANARSYSALIPSLATPTQMLYVQGKGCINWLAVFGHTSSSDLSLTLEIDGVVVCTTPSINYVSNDRGFLLIGGAYTNTTTADYSATFQPIYFESSVRLTGISSINGGTYYPAINMEIHA